MTITCSVTLSVRTDMHQRSENAGLIAKYQKQTFWISTINPKGYNLILHILAS